MRFRLRTLLIVLAQGPPLLAGAWQGFREYRRGEKTGPFGPIRMQIIRQEEEEPSLGIELLEP